MRSTAWRRGGQLSGGSIVLMAFACGAMAAILYYAQTLIDQIAPAIGFSPGLGGTITTLTQLGYGIGLFAVVPLGDLFENRRLVLLMTGGTSLSSLGIARSQGPGHSWALRSSPACARPARRCCSRWPRT